VNVPRNPDELSLKVPSTGLTNGQPSLGTGAVNRKLSPIVSVQFDRQPEDAGSVKEAQAVKSYSVGGEEMPSAHKGAEQRMERSRTAAYRMKSLLRGRSFLFFCPAGLGGFLC
jgi:hypothetical protein